jgi:hypothetical protein
MGMEISAAAGSPAMIMQANALDAVRTTLAAAQGATTPQAHADVILQLSTSAQALMTTTR